MNHHCKICKKEYTSLRGLSVHISCSHNSIKDYYDKFIKNSLTEGKCLFCGSLTMFMGIHGYRLYCSTKCSTSSVDVQKKMQDSTLKNHGYTHPGKSQKNKERMTKSNPMYFSENKIKFSQKWNSKSQEEKAIINSKISKILKNKTPEEKAKIVIKRGDSIFKKTGFRNASQVPEYKEKKSKTNIINCGFDNWSKSMDGRTSHRITAIKYTEEQHLNGEPLMPRVGIQERLVLDELQRYTNLKILRQDHRFAYGGEDGIGRFPDGYIEELRLIILFHERSVHYLNDECTIETEDTIQTTKDYESVGLTIFKISEYDWRNNKQLVIENFMFFINNFAMNN